MAILQQLLSQPMTERLGWTLIHFVWQAASIALLLAVVLRILRKCSASVRYVVACLALVLIVAVPLATMALVKVSEPIAEVGPVPAPVPIAEALPIEVIEVAELPIEPLDTPSLKAAKATIRVPWTQRAVAALEPALPYLVLGWLLGVFGLSAWHLGGWAQLQRMRRRMVREVGASLRTQLAVLSEKLGVRQAVGLLESALVEVPTVVGWVKPVILLPASALTGLDAQQLEAILAHELAHIRRHDYLVNIAQTVVEILGFYHPALWWISHRIRAERENCCDDLAVQVCGDSLRYARALTCLEEMRHQHTELALAASGGSLVHRIARLLDRPTPTRDRFTWLPGLIALLLVATILIPTALVLARPVTAPATDNSAVEVTTETQTDSKTQSETKILIDVIVAKVLADKILDRETLLGMGDLLATENPQAKDEIVGVASTPNRTLGKILQTSVTGKPLTPATIEGLINLLESRGYVEVQARPEVLTFNDEQAQIGVTSEEYFFLSEDSNAPPLTINTGTVLQATPHFSPEAADRITLEIAAQWTEPVGETPTGELATTTRTEMVSTVTVPRDHFFAFLMEPDAAGNTPKTDRESKLIMFRADCVETPAEQQSASVPPAQQSESQPRHVLLDARIVVMERTDLLNMGVDWGFPQISAGTFGADTTASWPWGVQVGYSADQTSTDSLLLALNRLEENGQAEIVSNPQVLAQDGKVSDIRVMTEEYYMLRAQTTENAQSPSTTKELVNVATGIVLSATPRIGDNNDITLELATEHSDSIPQKSGEELPVVTRRKARNVVTIQDKGTVALAGLAQRTDDSQKQLLVLMTAHLIPENALLEETDWKLGDDEPKPKMVTATFEGADLRTALMEIGQRAGVTIVCDPNVAGEIYAELKEVPLETALEIVLAGTPFVATKTPDYYLVTTREIAGKRQIAVETRFVLLDNAFMEALQRGLPIEGVTVPEDVNALHAIGADLLADETPLLEPIQVSLLLKSVHQCANSKALAAPKVTVLDGESASFSLADTLRYVSGYREANDASGEPVALPKSKTVGVAFDVTPRLIENNNIRVGLDMEMNSLLEMHKALYQGTYEYDVPSFEIVTIETESVIPDGHTALIVGGEIRSLDGTGLNTDQPARPWLILITPKKIESPPLPKK